MTAHYLDTKRIRALGREVDLKPSKGRGQNFLVDANTVRRIVTHSGVGLEDIVLEIGPGLGSLTIGLLHTGAQVVAVEIESSLAQLLPRTMRELAGEAADQLTVLNTDALRLTEVSPEPTTLVANLPYNISVPVLLHLLANYPSIRGGLVLVQKEVAERLGAVPGSKVYGIPSAKLAWYTSARVVGTVPATVFWPQPHVESGLVKFVRREPPLGADRDSTFALIDAAFSQRRKMLRSVLSSKYGPGLTDAFVQAGISGEARAETLSIEDFARLASALQG